MWRVCNQPIEAFVSASNPDVSLSLSLSLNENVRAKEGGKETTGETAFRQPSVPFPWSLAAHHQWLAKNKAPEEEAALVICRALREFCS